MSRQRIEIEVRHMDRLIKELKNISSKLDRQRPEEPKEEQGREEQDRDEMTPEKVGEILRRLSIYCEAIPTCEACVLKEICEAAGTNFCPSDWSLWTL